MDLIIRNARLAGSSPVDIGIQAEQDRCNRGAGLSATAPVWR